MGACLNQTFLTVAINYGFFQFKNVSNKLQGVKGTDFNILRVLSSKMKFQYELVTPHDQEWGICDDNMNNGCTGMIGMLARHEADMAISEITHTASRTKYVDFSYPYFYEEVTFATKTINAYQANLKVFIAEPFVRKVWIFLASLLIAFVSVVKIMKYFGILKTKILSVHTIFKTILRQDINLKRNEEKLSTVTILMALVVTAGCTCKLYECMLTSATSWSPVTPPIDTISDIVDAIRNRDYAISCWQGTSCYERVKKSKVKHMKIFVKSTLKSNFKPPKSTNHGVEMVLNGNFALVDSRTAIKRSLLEMNLPSQTLHVAKSTLFNDHIAIALRKQFPCKDDINKWINVLIGSGLIVKWHSNDLTPFNQTTNINYVSGSPYIVMGDLKFVFAGLICGYLSGFVTLTMEMMTNYFYTHLPVGS